MRLLRVAKYLFRVVKCGCTSADLAPSTLRSCNYSTVPYRLLPKHLDGDKNTFRSVKFAIAALKSDTNSQNSWRTVR